MKPAPLMAGERVHLIGIGGDGMSALARLFIEAGYRVSGSDVAERPILQTLRGLGAGIVIGHDPDCLADARRVVVSPAIPAHDPELLAARDAGFPIQSRAEALAGLLAEREVVCVAGSHGKTTTSAMLASILDRAGYDVGFAIGAPAPSLGNVNARLGTGPFVLEACEAFQALGFWRPAHCIVTNVEDEHIEHYGGVTGLHAAFTAFVGRVPESGVIAICGDDAGAVAAAAASGRAALPFGMDPNYMRARLERVDSAVTTCRVVRDWETMGSLTLRVPGIHNVRNALGALTCALGMGVTFDTVSAALEQFAGVERRWQFLGCAGGVHLFDDFAHHPTEISATLAMARRATPPGGRLVVAFVPQLHSRVRRLAKHFATSLAAADVVLVAPVESGDETLTQGDDALRIALRDSPACVIHVSATGSLARAALDHLRPGDLCVTIGPHPAAAAAAEIRDALNERAAIVESKASAYEVLEGPRTSPPSLVTERIAELAATRTSAVAVEGRESTLNYGELYDAAGRFANSLLRRGAEHGDLIAVCMETSEDRIVAFVGIMLAGCVYLPVDPHLPASRIRIIIEDARPRFAVAEAAFEAPFVANGTPVLNVNDLTAAPASGLDRPIRRSDLAYIVYTSGSTGTPNGVAIDHAALSNFAAAAVKAFDVRNGSRLAHLSAFGFDVAIGEVTMALFAGAGIVLPAPEVVRSRSALGAFVEQRAITHLTLTPSLLTLLPRGEYPELGHIIVAGEACPQDLMETWAMGRRFFNAYGPTEATIYATIGECFAGNPVTIGRPIDNVGICVISGNGRPARPGDIGELWIAGEGLAREYYRQPQLTSERFCEVSWPSGHERAYRTGDLARVLPDGRLSFEGRHDRQIKLHGLRIEPAEVEAALRAHPAIEDAAVVLDTSGRPRLAAYLVCSGAMAAPQREDVATFLSTSLPAPMIPSKIVRVPSIPVDVNGKRDDAALIATRDASSTRRPVSPRTAAEAILVDILKREIGAESSVSVRDTLDDLGVDSVGIVLLVAAIEEHFAIELPLEATSSSHTLADLAAMIETAATISSRRRFPLDPSVAILRKQALYVAQWSGERRGDDSLILTQNPLGDLRPLYWCFQVTHEHQNLASHIGKGRPVHGMRSGYLLFDYTDGNIDALARHYADEMFEMQPDGEFVLGGNCQGATIAVATAQQLVARGRRVALLLMLNPTKLFRLDLPVALIFGEDDQYNPYLPGTDCDALFRDAYTGGYTVDIIPGKHSGYFTPPNVVSLATVLSARIGAIEA